MGVFEKLTEYMDKRLGPIAYKISKNKFVETISSAFVMLMPIVLIGSFASLIAGIDNDLWQSFISSTGIKTAASLVNTVTTNMYSIYVAFAIAFRYIRKKYSASAPAVGLIAVVMFMFVTPLAVVENTSYISFSYLGAKGMLGAMIVGLFVGALVEFFYDRKLYIKMPDGVPPAIADSFKLLIPGIVLFILGAFLNAATAGAGGFQSIIYNFLSAPLSTLSNNLLTKIIIDTVTNILWFFGIHGGNVTNSIMNILYNPGTQENIANFAEGLPLTNIITKGFHAITGGTTTMNFCLCIMCMMSKKKEFKSIGNVSFLPALFGISEPIRFGLPMVLNPYMFIPTFLVVIANNVITYVAMVIGLLPYPRSTTASGIPIFLKDIMNVGLVPGIIIFLVLFVVNFIIVYPFFKMYEAHGIMGTEESEQ